VDSITWHHKRGGGKEGERPWQTETLTYAGPHAFAFPCTPI